MKEFFSGPAPKKAHITLSPCLLHLLGPRISSIPMYFLFFQTSVDTVWNCLLSICLPPFACHGWDRQWWYMHDPLEGIWGPAGMHIEWDPPGALSCPCLHPGPPKAQGISLSRRPGWETVLCNTFMGGGLENLWCYFTSAFTESTVLPGYFWDTICELRMVLVRDSGLFECRRNLMLWPENTVVYSCLVSMIIRDLVEFLNPLPNCKKMYIAVVTQC